MPPSVRRPPQRWSPDVPMPASIIRNTMMRPEITRPVQVDWREAASADALDAARNATDARAARLWNSFSRHRRDRASSQKDQSATSAILFDQIVSPQQERSG